MVCKECTTPTRPRKGQIEIIMAKQINHIINQATDRQADDIAQAQAIGILQPCTTERSSNTEQTEALKTTNPV